MRFIGVPDRAFSARTIEAHRHGFMQVFEVRGRTTLSASELSSKRSNALVELVGGFDGVFY